jgi:hypothetical protein
VSDPYHQYQHHIVAKGVNNPPIANAQTVPGIASQRFDIRRGTGSGGKPIQAAQNARLYRAIKGQQFRSR